ncbi:MAG: DUF2784 domain-containing protein [Proteobacteria bacterium]|nr:DUF2784 domain-containing protein [Pseudomonadota bacterium]
MWYSIVADLIVVLHLSFVIFVVAGGLLVLKWRWILYAHIPAAVWGVLLEFQGWGCPLTPLEKSLRITAGEEGYSGGFIEYYLVPLIYPGEITRDIQIWVGVFVIIINMVIYGLVIARRKR